MLVGWLATSWLLARFSGGFGVFGFFVVCVFAGCLVGGFSWLLSGVWGWCNIRLLGLLGCFGYVFCL